MDQIKKIGQWLKEQHFWVLVVLAVLVAMGCWWRGASALLAEYKTNRGMIDKGFSDADSVNNKATHANEKVQEAQNAEIAKQQQAVSALWQQLYERQTAAVLKWPSNLSEEFRNYIAGLKFGADIPTNLRDHYNNYIRDHFPELPKIVGALEMPDTGQSSGMGRGMGGGGGASVQSILDNIRGGAGGRGGEGGMGEVMPEQDFLVIWADQQLVRDELYPSKRPSSKRIWKTQEDLWVYEALLHIIANTNKAAGADRFSNAAVRIIESLEVGRTAAQASRGKGRIDIVETAPVGGEMGMEGGMGMGMEMGMEGGGRGMEGGLGMEGGGYGGEMGMGMEGGGYGRGGMMAGAADSELFNNRYVDANGAPIPDAGGDQSAFGVEFKRLPVRMRLWMDQRYLPQLIAECASAPLQVEIQEVRINVADDAGGGGMGRGGMGGGVGRGGEGGFGMGAMAGEAMTPEQEPNMKSIVLQGTVYIFNPPSEGAPAAGDVATAMPQ